MSSLSFISVVNTKNESRLIKRGSSDWQMNCNIDNEFYQKYINDINITNLVEYLKTKNNKIFLLPIKKYYSTIGEIDIEHYYAIKEARCIIIKNNDTEKTKLMCTQAKRPGEIIQIGVNSMNMCQIPAIISINNSKYECLNLK